MNIYLAPSSTCKWHRILILKLYLPNIQSHALINVLWELIDGEDINMRTILKIGIDVSLNDPPIVQAKVPQFPYVEQVRYRTVTVEFIKNVRKYFQIQKTRTIFLLAVNVLKKDRCCQVLVYLFTHSYISCMSAFLFMTPDRFFSIFYTSVS